MKTTKRKFGLITLAIVLIAILLVIYMMESWAKTYVNNQIEALEGYSGGVTELDIDLWRGAYQIQGLKLDKEAGGLKEKFLTIDTVDLSIRWQALLHGQIVAEVDLKDPVVSFAKAQSGGEGGDWLTLLQSLTPFDISRFEIENGKIEYLDYQADPNIDLFIKDLYVKVTNISNVINKDKALPSNININGSTIGGGNLSIAGGMNILKNIPDFDLSLKVEDADLPYFNDYFKKYALLDFQKGVVSVFGEVASLDGQVTGYIKPIVTDIDMLSLEDDANPFNFVWEATSAFFLEAFQNQPKDQFALRIPIEGTLTAPEQGIWSGIGSIFTNAFDNAFKKDVDGTINLKDLIEKSNSE